MQLLDYLVLVGYFAVMIAIGIYSSRMIKAQEDFFMGGRSFGKLLQTFAAFGAGTGSSDPVNTGRTTFTSGMSGMWSMPLAIYQTANSESSRANIHQQISQRQEREANSNTNHKSYNVPLVWSLDLDVRVRK